MLRFVSSVARLDDNLAKRATPVNFCRKFGNNAPAGRLVLVLVEVEAHHKRAGCLDNQFWVIRAGIRRDRDCEHQHDKQKKKRVKSIHFWVSSTHDRVGGRQIAHIDMHDSFRILSGRTQPAKTGYKPNTFVLRGTLLAHAGTFQRRFNLFGLYSAIATVRLSWLTMLILAAEFP